MASAGTTDLTSETVLLGKIYHAERDYRRCVDLVRKKCAWLTEILDYCRLGLTKLYGKKHFATDPTAEEILRFGVRWTTILKAEMQINMLRGELSQFPQGIALTAAGELDIREHEETTLKLTTSTESIMNRVTEVTNSAVHLAKEIDKDVGPFDDYSRHPPNGPLSLH